MFLTFAEMSIFQAIYDVRPQARNPLGERPRTRHPEILELLEREHRLGVAINSLDQRHVARGSTR